MQLVINNIHKCQMNMTNNYIVDLLTPKIYPDNFAKREMMDFEVSCRAKKQHGCMWKGPLKKLQVCTFISPYM